MAKMGPAEVNALTLWEYGALQYQWAERQPDHDAAHEPPTAEDLDDMRADLISRNDPRVRLH